VTNDMSSPEPPSASFDPTRLTRQVEQE
jgi:hypothetical protein